MTPKQVLQKFPCFKVADGMELIEWGKNECPEGCYLVAFDDDDKDLYPIVKTRQTHFPYDKYFLIRPKQ